MGIFSRWATPAPGVAPRSDDDESERTSKLLRDVRMGSGSLAKFLKERQLLPLDENDAIDRARERVEKSGLMRIMMETCAAINELVGRTIVDVHSFLPPEPILCCFIFVEDGTEYLMRLDLKGGTPVLVFAERKWRDTVTNDFVRWAHRLAEIEPVTVNVKLVHEFEDISVTAEQVRQWFMYLVSGMDRSHAPSF
jgi:hypothetical protein